MLRLVSLFAAMSPIVGSEFMARKKVCARDVRHLIMKFTKTNDIFFLLKFILEFHGNGLYSLLGFEPLCPLLGGLYVLGERAGGPRCTTYGCCVYIVHKWGVRRTRRPTPWHLVLSNV